MSRLAALDDDALADVAAKGHREALELLLERFAPVAVRVAYGVVSNREDALDAAQTALIQVATQLATHWKGVSFRPWLCACAHGAAVNLSLSSRSRKRREKGAAQPESPLGPEGLSERQEVLRALREEIARLPNHTGLVLGLHHLEGQPVADIAEQFGLSVEACWQRLSRGRELLKQRLERRGVTGALGLEVLLVSLADAARNQAGEVASAMFRPMAESAAAYNKTTVLSLSKGWLSYWALAAVVLLVWALLPVFVSLPEDPRPLYRPVAPQPNQAQPGAGLKSSPKEGGL